LLVSTYIDIKQNLSKAMLKDFDETLPIRDILRKLWINAFSYISKYPDYFQLIEQFSNSPYSSLVDKNAVEKYFERMLRVLQRGVDEKIIKNVSFDILIAFIFFPVMILSNSRLCENFEQNESNIETAFTLAWDAIRL
jgi:hypothetical protein